MMQRWLLEWGMAGTMVAVAGAAYAQVPARPQIATTKVEGTDGVYVFRNGNHPLTNGRATQLGCRLLRAATAVCGGVVLDAAQE
jgi:hypothetical protein